MSVTSRTILADLEWLLPQIRESVLCPNLYRNMPVTRSRDDLRTFGCAKEEGKLFDIVMHLNDICHWTRAQIADWLETLDVDLEFPTNPPPRPARLSAQTFYSCSSSSIDMSLSSLFISMEMEEQAKKTTDAFKAMCAVELKTSFDLETFKLFFGGAVESGGDPSPKISSLPLIPKKNKVYPQPKLSKKERKDGRRRSSY